MSASTQYVTNGNYATSTLQLEEQAMSDATNTLQSARDLAVEANNPALSASQRTDIAAQLQQQLQDLISIGNRVDGSGNHLFAGTASDTVPFSQSGHNGLLSRRQTRRARSRSARTSGSPPATPAPRSS